MSTTPVIWNQVTTDTPQPFTIMGMPGWWSVPRHWYARSREGGDNQWEVCEDAEFSGKVYIAVLADDGITRVFQDLLRNRAADNDR